MRNLLPFLTKYRLVLILFLALILRLIVVRHAGYASFPEQWRDMRMVSDIAHGVSFPLLGPPSMLGGFHFPAHYYYFMTPLFMLSGFHPVGLLLTGVVFSVLSIFALYRLLLLWSGREGVALVGALLSAVSVYSLHLVSYTSNPNFLPLFVLWFLYSLTKILQGSTRWVDYAYLGLAGAFASCLHTTATFELPFIALLGVVLVRPKLHVRMWAATCMAAVVVYIPYIYYECTHGFQNTLRLFSLGTSALQGAQGGLNGRMLWNFWEGTLTPFNYWYGYTIISPNWLYWVVALCMTWVVVCVVYALRGKQNLGMRVVRYSRLGVALLWSWICVASVTLLVYTKGPHDHYIIILWPAPVIVLTWVLFWLKDRFGVLKPVLALLLVTACLQIYSFINMPYVSWKNFIITYESQYKNQPGVSEVGAVW